MPGFISETNRFANATNGTRFDKTNRGDTLAAE